MNFDNSQPIYMQIIDEYKKSIIRTEFKPGDKIPSQREYAQMVRVNPNTVQRAYREMENMGIVGTLRGQGTFITAGEQMRGQMAKEMAGKVMKHFITEMRSLGYEDGVIVNMLERDLELVEEGEQLDRI